MNSPLPKSAYIHVPFCVHRCGYCDFTVVAGREDLIGDYLQAMEIELGWLESPRPVQTIFFGGGTPTQLPPVELAQLLDLVRQWFVPADDAEISVEANPADLSDATIEVLLAAGVNRLSLGAQSFDADKLRLLERDHDANQIAQVVASAKAAGLKNISLDLIFAAPGETLEAWLQDIESALALDVPHVSTYGLTFERGTTFDTRRLRGELTPVDDELQRQMYLAAIERLRDAGLQHYEVSNFARPGFRSRHNESYWLGHEYYAAGPGATRYVQGRRETNHRSTTTWLKQVLAGTSPVSESEQLDPEERARERLIFALRRLDGVSLAEFAHQTGFTADQLAGEALQKFESLGLLVRKEGILRLTQEGLLVSDAMWPELLS